MDARLIDARPAAWLVAITLLQAICWTMAPLLVAYAPPLDVVENAIWGTERVLVSYKNPALPGLLLEATRVLTGTVGWPAFVLSQLCIVAAVWCVYFLGREVIGSVRAAAGSMVLLCCYYFNWHTPEFNHDILQIPFWAAIVLCLWRALEAGSLLWWTLLGLTAAGSLYGKLSPAVLLISCALWLIVDVRGRAALFTPGPWLALAVFALALSPLLVWLLKHGFLAAIQSYATERGNKHSLSHSVWALIQIGMIVPMAIAIWLSRIADNTAAGAPSLTPNEREFRRYLLFLTIMPAVLMVLLAVSHGTGAKLMWGVPMLNMAGLLLVSFLVPRAHAQGLARLAYVTGAVIIAMSGAYAAAVHFGPRWRNVPPRLDWPQQAIATRMREIWTAQTHAPLRIVAGERDNWVSGLVALTGGPVASVFTDANEAYSPWITPQRLQQEGALIVWDERADAPSDKLRAFIGAFPITYESFELPVSARATTVRVGYAIMPPGAPQGP